MTVTSSWDSIFHMDVWQMYGAEQQAYRLTDVWHFTAAAAAADR